MGYNKTNITSSAPTLTSQDQREVSDKYRFHGRKKAKLLSLVASGTDDSVSKGGMISKRKVNNVVVEGFYALANAFTKTVTAANDGTGVYGIGSTGDVSVRAILFNTRTKEVGIVDVVSGANVTVIPTNGGTFTAQVGDTIKVIGYAYEVGSQTVHNYWHDDSRFFNHTSIYRQAITWDKTKENISHYSGDYIKQRKKQAYIDGMYLIENELLFSKKAVTGLTTAMTALGVNIPTMDGIYQTAQGSVNMNGSLTLQKLIRSIPDALHTSIDSSKQLMAFCGNSLFGKIQEIITDKITPSITPGTVDQFGWVTNTILTHRGKLVFTPHEAFNDGDLQNEIFIFAPDAYEFCYLRDFHEMSNIGIKEYDSQKDEILAFEGCILDNAAGYHALKVLNCGIV